uniref:Uncharacterized protein n=1 Tax=Arundo donax TaxID=35708 RepID=A0A0A8YDA1_ARUDO
MYASKISPWNFLKLVHKCLKHLLCSTLGNDFCTATSKDFASIFTSCGRDPIAFL